jgi:hypothetical protein
VGPFRDNKRTGEVGPSGIIRGQEKWDPSGIIRGQEKWDLQG